MKRIAVVLEKNLSTGGAANVAAILAGQNALLNPELYDAEPVADTDGHRHAGIKYSTIILEAGSGQLSNLVHKVKTDHQNVTCVLFSRVGQGLNNAFEAYKATIASTSTDGAKPVGVIVAGEDSEIRALTKKFSVFK